MKKTNSRFGLVIVSLCLLVPPIWAKDSENGISSTSAPVFEAFPAKTLTSPHKYASKIILATPRSKRYRTIISLEGRKEPNFAGHYRVVTWGCGTDCHGFAIVDRVTGIAFTDPSIEYVAGAMGNNEPRIDFRSNSRLLILNGLINDDREGKFFYEWTGKGLRLINRAPLLKEDLLDDATRRN